MQRTHGGVIWAQRPIVDLHTSPLYFGEWRAIVTRMAPASKG